MLLHPKIAMRVLRFGCLSVSLDDFMHSDSYICIHKLAIPFVNTHDIRYNRKHPSTRSGSQVGDVVSDVVVAEPEEAPASTTMSEPLLAGAEEMMV